MKRKEYYKFWFTVTTSFEIVENKQKNYNSLKIHAGKTITLKNWSNQANNDEEKFFQIENKNK